MQYSIRNLRPAIVIWYQCGINDQNLIKNDSDLGGVITFDIK
jgi:hypothetical protein